MKLVAAARTTVDVLKAAYCSNAVAAQGKRIGHETHANITCRQLPYKSSTM